jgi:hypothetical protein
MIDGAVVVSSLELTGNTLINGQSMVYFNTNQLSLNSMTCTANNSTNIVIIDLANSKNSQSIQISSGDFQSNTVYGGSVFLIREDLEIDFEDTLDAKPSS